jgi:hypothetical protein
MGFGEGLINKIYKEVNGIKDIDVNMSPEGKKKMLGNDIDSLVRGAQTVVGSGGKKNYEYLKFMTKYGVGKEGRAKELYDKSKKERGLVGEECDELIRELIGQAENILGVKYDGYESSKSGVNRDPAYRPESKQYNESPIEIGVAEKNIDVPEQEDKAA